MSEAQDAHPAALERLEGEGYMAVSASWDHDLKLRVVRGTDLLPVERVLSIRRLFERVPM